MRNNKCKKIGFFKWSSKRNDSLKPFQVLNSLEFPLNKLIIQKNYAISLNENNEVFLWGSLTENKDGDFLNMLPSKIIMNPRDKSIRKMVTNNNLIYLLTENGNIYCYGNSDYGLLGMGSDIISAKKPILLEYFCKNNIFITEITLSDKMAASTNVLGQIFVWGTIMDQNLINEPTFLLNYDKKIVRLETTNNFLYVLNDEGDLYFFKHKAIIKNSEYTFTKCKFLQNQYVIEINTNKFDDNLICCLTKEGNIFLITNDESSLQIPNNFDVLYYSMNFFNDRILCFGMSYNETYFFEWKLKKEQTKTLPKLYKGFIYKILDNNIDYISLIPSFSTNIISFIYDEKNINFKTLKNNLNILLDDEKPNFFKSFKEKEKDCLNYEFLEEIDMEKIKKNFHCHYDIYQKENKENEEMNNKLINNKQSKIEYEISLLKQNKIKRNLSQEKYDQIKAQTTQILMKNINNKKMEEKKFKNFEILFKLFQKTIGFIIFSQRKFVFQKILKNNKFFKKQKKYSLKIIKSYQV